jgi:MYXO-CTERM domain-containing protein
MDSAKLAAMALAFPILGTAAIPGVAQACDGYYGPCQGGYEFWQDLTPVNAAKIPSDGVLVLQGNHQGDDAASLPSIELTVTKDGQPIAGALEATSMHGVLVWRPVDPWEAGATYALSGNINNPPESEACAQLLTPIGGDSLTIDVAPGSALGTVEFSGETMVQSYPTVSLDTLACCEGAMPSVGYVVCGGDYVDFDPAECAPTQGYGYLSVQIDGEPAATGPAGGQIVYTLKVDGNPYSTSLTPVFDVTTDAPFCAVIEATDLASGAVDAGQKHCFGEAVAGQLGPQVLDPKEKLQCALEQCATDGVPPTWDPMACTPFDPESPTTSDSDGGGSSGSGTAGEGEDDKGCNCDVRSGSDAGLLALIGLVGLVRRRRRR